MPTADDDQLREQIGLSVDNEASIRRLLELEASVRAGQQQQIETILGQQEQLAQAQQVSVRDQQRLQEQATQQQALSAEAVDYVNRNFIDPLDLTDDEKRSTRLSGHFDAAVLRQIRDEREKLSGQNSDRAAGRRQLLDEAERLYRMDIANFAESAQAEGLTVQDHNAISDEVAGELVEQDGVGGFLRNIAASATSGLIGVAGIGAGLAGADGLAGQLGGAARATRDAIGTQDIGSVAAQQQFGEVIARTQRQEGDPQRLSIPQAIVEGAKLGLDGDFAADLLSGTAGALVGGGGIGGAARLGATALNATGRGGAAARGLNRVADANQSLNRATAGAPAVAAGIGSGVDEDLNAAESRGLAGTIGASALLGRALPTVEGAVLGAPAAAGTRQGIAGAAARTAGGEAAQEFVEGAGESLSGRAGELGSVGAALQDPNAVSEALATGAVSAPLGAGLGAGFGAGAAVANNRAVNAAQTPTAAPVNPTTEAAEATAPTDQAAPADPLDVPLRPPAPAGPTLQQTLLSEDPARSAQAIREVFSQEPDVAAANLSELIANTQPELLPEQVQAIAAQVVNASQQEGATLRSISDTLQQSLPAQTEVAAEPEGTLTDAPALGDSVSASFGTAPNQPSPQGLVDLGPDPNALPRTPSSATEADSLGLPDQGTLTSFSESDTVTEVDATAETESTVEEQLLNPSQFGENFDNVLNTRADNPLLAGLSADQRRSLGSNGTFKRTKTRMRALLRIDPRTPEQETELQSLAEKQAGIINAKKPNPLAEGETNSASFRPDPAKPQTATPEFQQFFEGSRVVDENQQPLELYHGTISSRVAEELNPGSPSRDPEGFIVDELGAFFTNNRDLAARYAAEGRELAPSRISEIIPAYLSFKNPLVMDAGGRDFSTPDADSQGQLADPVFRQFQASPEYASLGIDGVKSYAEKLGHDSAIIKNTLDNFAQGNEGNNSVAGDQYVAFSPTQIKSSDNNSGSFDATNPDIRQSRLAPQGIPRSARPPRPTSPRLLPSEGRSGPVEQTFTSERAIAGVGQLVATLPRAARNSVKAISASDSVITAAGLDPARTAGFVDRDGTAYIVTDNISNEQQLQDVFAEELFHRGLRRQLGGNYDNTLDSIFKRRGGVRGLLQLGRTFAGSEIETNYSNLVAAAQRGDKDAQRELTDEVLARVAIRPENATSGIINDVKKIIGKLREYVNKVFGKETADLWSDQDLIQLTRQANAQGRLAGDPNQPIEVRANSMAPGEFNGLDQNGNRVYHNIGRSPERADTNGVQDFQEATRRLIQARNTLGDQQVRQDLKSYIGDKWGSIQQKFADVQEFLGRVENEFNKAAPDIAEVLTTEALQDTEAPPLVQRILRAANNPELRKNLWSIATSATTYSSKADDLLRRQKVLGDKTFFELFQNNQNLINQQANMMGIDPSEVYQTVTRYMQALHTEERNRISYLKSVKLDGADPDTETQREGLVKALVAGTLSVEGRAELENIVDTNADTPFAEWDRGTGMTVGEAQQVIDIINRESPEVVQQYDAIAQSYYDIISATNNVNRGTGSLTKGLDDTIASYGWQNYIPMRGNGIDTDENLSDGHVTLNASNVFAQTFREFEGRSSTTDDTFTVIYQGALNSLVQQEQQAHIASVVAHVQGNSIDTSADSDPEGLSHYKRTFFKDGNGGDALRGRMVELNPNSPEFKRLMANKVDKRLVYYNPDNARLAKGDQTALVIDLADSRMADAIVARRSQRADAFDEMLRSVSYKGRSIHDVTRFMASLKTYRNLPFIPFDALRNMLTFGYATANDEGLSGWQGFMMEAFTNPNIKNIYNYTNLRTKGEFDKLQQLVAEAGEGSELALLDQFFQLGGPSNPIQGIRDASSGTIRELAGTRASGGNVAGRVNRQAEDFFQTMNQSADLMARFAMYKTLLKRGETPQRAAARAKNVANFEKRGTWSGPLSGLFEFFNATAIGGTALINSTVRGRYGPQTLAAAGGAGYMLYMIANALAGTDENDEDRLASVNGRLYTNNFVFQYGDEPTDRLQFGIGFGPVAVAISSGIQLARSQMGHQGIKEGFDNATAAFTGQANILPLSQISPTESPVQFGFDSATPSVLKPFYQLATNMSSLGLPIRSDFPGADFGDASASFSGRYNSSGELYEETSELLRQLGIMDIAPESMRHLTRSYLGGVSYAIESVFENYQAATGNLDGEYNLKNGLYPARQFFASTYGQQRQTFYQKFNRVADLADRLSGLERSNLGDSAEAERYRSSDVYQNNIDLFEETDLELGRINDRWRDTIRDDTLSAGEVRAARRERDNERAQVEQQFIEAFQD